MTLLQISYLLAGLMLTLACVLACISKRKSLNEKAHRHFVITAGLTIDGSHTDNTPQSRRRLSMEQLFRRAGLQPKAKHLIIIGTITVFFTTLVIQKYSVATGLLVPLLIILLLYMWLWQRTNSRIKAVLIQLPLFLDQTLRALSTGRSMESALQLATEETPQPLKELFDRVLRANRLGHDLGQSIQQTAELYRVQELYLIALAIRVNRTYGTNVRDLLNNIVKMIHDREAARRELRTMTGETRVTAWVLGVLPIAIAGYIVMMNPGYMMAMWEDASGKWILIAALGFQAVGALILWRMIKSI